ncbi:unnamed protein product, partial [Oppiella nova]
MINLIYNGMPVDVRKYGNKAACTKYFDRKCDYWRKQGVRTASVSLYTRLTKQCIDWERDLYVRNGKCFGVYELGKPVLYLSDPELI